MKTTLTTLAPEQGTYAVEISFTNEAGEAMTPDSGLAWSLTDRFGTVVNSRSAVDITSASTITIVLQGADLTVSDPNERYRLITVEGTYDSATLGNNLPFKYEVKFKIADYAKVS